MLKYLLKKTYFKKYNKEDKEIFIKLKSRPIYMLYLSSIMILSIIFIPMILNIAFLSFIPENTVPIKIQIIFSLVDILFYSLFMLFIFVFAENIGPFRNAVSIRMHFLLFTKRGKAISKYDFKLIRKNYNELYSLVSSNKCQGYCYGISFDLLNVLKKGKLKFISVKRVGEDDEIKDGLTYTAHVLYVNNGWAFDTYSQEQFKIEEIMDIFKAIEYKEFSYEDIKDLSYDEFRDTNYDEFAKWCKENRVHQVWKNEQ